MNKEFITYEQALALKELGFDEPCLAGYQLQKATLFSDIPHTLNGNIHKNSEGSFTCAPTYSQAFRWFREKHNLMFNLNCYNFVKPIEYHWSITWNDEAKGHGLVETYEEAEQACLDKLIEIIKNK